MSQIIKALFIGIGLPLLLSGCGDTSSKVVYYPENGNHPAGWTTGHKVSAKADIESCIECHGESLDGGIANVSCTKCHIGSSGAIHPQQWGHYAYARHKSYVGMKGAASCANAVCHGPSLTGVAGSGGSCATECHMGGAYVAHPAIWSHISSHANYVKMNAGKHDGCSTAACHGTDSRGVFLSGPSCTECHMNLITAVHPEAADWRNIEHKGYTSPGLTINQTRAKCDSTVCHGTYNDATKPGLTKVDKSCAAGSCHAGDKN